MTHEIAAACVCPVWVRVSATTVKTQDMRIEPGWLIAPPEAGQKGP